MSIKEELQRYIDEHTKSLEEDAESSGQFAERIASRLRELQPFVDELREVLPTTYKLEFDPDHTWKQFSITWLPPDIDCNEWKTPEDVTYRSWSVSAGEYADEDPVWRLSHTDDFTGRDFEEMFEDSEPMKSRLLDSLAMALAEEKVESGR